jgi:hypothetical protein
MKSTSIKSYHEILPLLPERRRQVYETLAMLEQAHGPQAGSEVARYALNRYGIDGGWKRLSELQNLGLVRVSAYGKNPNTGKTVDLWQTVKRPCVGALKKKKKAR